MTARSGASEASLHDETHESQHAIHTFITALSGERRSFEGEVSMRASTAWHLVTGAIAVLAAGCGEDVCVTYREAYFAKLEECGQFVEDGEEIGRPVECTDTLAEQARCLEECLPQYDCPCGLDSTGPGCDAKLAAYNDCVDACF